MLHSLSQENWGLERSCPVPDVPYQRPHRINVAANSYPMAVAARPEDHPFTPPTSLVMISVDRRVASHGQNLYFAGLAIGVARVGLRWQALGGCARWV